MTYAGDILPKDAWRMLGEDPSARLIDVRTAAELNWVGFPDLSETGKELIAAEWITFPAMAENPDFVQQVGDAVGDKDATLIFICRSGVRSRSAAEAMTAAGYGSCYNLAGGFEGDRNDDGHRGTVNGWKVDALPWRQN